MPFKSAIARLLDGVQKHFFSERPAIQGHHELFRAEHRPEARSVLLSEVTPKASEIAICTKAGFLKKPFFPLRRYREN